MKFFTILVALAISTASALAGVWTQLASLPVSEGYSTANTLVYGTGDVDGIYATVGYVWLGGQNFRVSSEFYRYSISSNSWSRLADAPVPMEHNVGMSDATGNGIIMNRGNWSNEYLRYDITHNSWQQRGWGPGPYGAGASDNGSQLGVYYTGGMWDQRLYGSFNDGLSWQTLADNPEPMAYNSMQHVDGKLYTTVGKTDWTNTSSHFYAYDTSLGIWLRLADIPVATYSHALLSVGNGKLLLNSGQSSSDPLGLYEYDIAMNRWSRIGDTPTVFPYARAVYDGNRYSYWRENGTTAFFRYDPVPEPATMAVFGLGLLAFVKRHRR